MSGLGGRELRPGAARGELAWMRLELAELRARRASLTLGLFPGPFGWVRTAVVVGAFAGAWTWFRSGDPVEFALSAFQLSSFILLVRWARDLDERKELDAKIVELEEGLDGFGADPHEITEGHR